MTNENEGVETKTVAINQSETMQEHTWVETDLRDYAQSIFTNGANGRELVRRSVESWGLGYDIEQLGLSNIHFKVHCRNLLSRADIPERLGSPNSHVYVLLHGWTGTNEIFDGVKKSNGQSIVEQILKNDPHAIIICPDGNGFGNTKFKESLSFNQIVENCSPEDYAQQIAFLLSYLGRNKEHLNQTYYMGHSMGGAAVLELVKNGWALPENCVAVCPALLPTQQNLENLKAKGGRTARTAYKGLAVSVGLAVLEQGLEKLLTNKYSGLSDKAVEIAFNKLLAEYLMGSSHSGAAGAEHIKYIVDTLKEIHVQQTTKLKVTSAAMVALAKGTDVEKWTAEQIESVGKVHVWEGEKDILVRAEDVDSLRYVARARYNAETNHQIPFLEDRVVVAGAGHYATLYGSKEGYDPTEQLINLATKRNVA